MRIEIDKENDAIYLRLNTEEIVESEEIQPGIILDFDGKKRVVGIEILGISTLPSDSYTLPHRMVEQIPVRR